MCISVCKKLYSRWWCVISLKVPHKLNKLPGCLLVQSIQQSILPETPSGRSPAFEIRMSANRAALADSRTERRRRRPRFYQREDVQYNDRESGQ